MKNNEDKRFTGKDLTITILGCVIVILICVIVWAFSRKANDKFVAEFSFAATISSIILSSIAIFMSITGESKTAVIRDRIEKEADDIAKSNSEMKDLIQQLSIKIEEVQSGNKVIMAAINESLQTPRASETPPVTTEEADAAQVVDDKNTPQIGNAGDQK